MSADSAVSPKKGDAVAPPAVDDEWHIRFGTADAAKGWPELVNKAAGNARRAWDLMRTSPGQNSNDRHHQLKGEDYSTARHDGRVLPQWQIEVTGGGRIWYLIDEVKHTIWILYASLRHPKGTEPQ
jgi:hypothetical protein